MNLFVYGMLRPGGSLFDEVRALLQGRCEAHLEGRLFVMPDGLPVAVEAEPAYPIRGDLLIFPDDDSILEHLDEVEAVGTPHALYHRVQRSVVADSGDDLAFVYLCQPSEATRVMSAGEELPEGDYLAWRAEQRRP
jgi:gamma-glutamylcyclotransferase (GGCT)/AIG2-like uncharacterized protein YtfP